LARSEHEARHLYEKVYCARGDMENRIKIAMGSVCPYQNEFALAHLRLTATAH